MKAILDALIGVVYLDDSQIERVWVQKFESGRPFLFRSPTEVLADALEHDRPVVYVRTDNDKTRIELI